MNKGSLDNKQGFNFRIESPSPDKNTSNYSSADKETFYGNSHLVFSKIQIDGREVLQHSTYQVQINQTLLEHNNFTLTCPSEAFESLEDYPFQNTAALLGKKITIQFKQFTQTAFIFTGFISQLSHKRKDGYTHLVLTGESTTLLMKYSEQAQSFENLTLEEIVKNTVQQGNYPSDLLEFSIAPIFKDKLPYTVCYNQTPFDFIKSLAQRYGEWLYYDSQKLVFGSYGGKTIELVEEYDIEEYQLKMKIKPQKFSYLSYQSTQAETLQSDTTQPINRKVDLTNTFQQKAVKTSEDRFPQTGESLFNTPLLTQGEKELKEAVQRQKQANENVLYLEAKSNNPNLRLGDIVKLKAYMPQNKTFKTGQVPLESYRITDIQHHFNDTDGYYNTFTGIPKEQQIPPYYNPKAYPAAEEQRAVVTDYNDPEQMGRIRVQFDWQKKDNQQSPWIRLLQPYAGAGKGIYFRPEIGEEVQIAFESHHPEKPYATGTHYNGKEKSGYHTPENSFKVIKTDSGHYLEFEELKNITLADAKGNKLHIDSEKSNINITALETITIKAKNLVVDIEEDIKTTAGKDIQTTAKNNITQDSGKKTIIASGDNTEISANRELDLFGKRQLIGYTEGKTEFGAKGQMHVYGGNSLITAQDKIEYKAPQMGKLAEAGEFDYTKEKQIVGVSWLHEKEEKEVIKELLGNKIRLLIQTRNYEEGETVSIVVKDKNSNNVQGDKKEIPLTGIVQADGTAVLQEESITIEDIERPPKEKTAEEIQQEEEKKKAQEEYKQWEEEQWQKHQAKKNNKGFFGF